MRSTFALVVAAAISALQPDPPIDLVDWAEANLVVPDGPFKGEKWKRENAPYLVPVLEALSPDDPCVEVTLRANSQIGKSLIGIGWLGAMVDQFPAEAMLVSPTVNAARGFEKEKLKPALDASQVIKSKIRPTKSRDADGSTQFYKKFPGGFIVQTGANTSVDLSSKTVRYAWANELDRWPADVDNEGDPSALLDARQVAFHADGRYKRFNESTPTIKGASPIDAKYEDGTCETWQCCCPHCGAEQELIWEGLRWEEGAPETACYVCQVNGCVIEEKHKRRMVSMGRAIAEFPERAQRHRSFDVFGLCSILTTWAELARGWETAKGNTKAERAFFNTKLGRSYEIDGEAPDWEKLWERKKTYQRGELPPGVLIITVGGDIQGNRGEFEVVGWGVGMTSWSIDYRVIEGDPTQAEFWNQVAALLASEWTDWQGNKRHVDVAGIDANYLKNYVGAFVRGRPNCFGLVGRPGWRAPTVGTPEQTSINLPGKTSRKRFGRYPVGTWDMKLELYQRLRLEPSAETGYPLGYCHFPEGYDEKHYEGLTAEVLMESQTRGGIELYWHKPSGKRNEQLDCRVYARAAADHPLMRARGLKPVSLMTAADWEALAAERGAPPESAQLDLLAQAFNAPPAKPRENLAEKLA